MAIETECQTPGAVFHTAVQPRHVSVSVDLPFAVDLPEDAAGQLKANLHNAVELVMAPYFPGMGRRVL